MTAPRPPRGQELRTIWWFLTEMFSAGSGLVAGPACTEPSVEILRQEKIIVIDYGQIRGVWSRPAGWRLRRVEVVLPVRSRSRTRSVFGCS